MQLTCNGHDLYDATTLVLRAIDTNAVNPILEGIKVTARNNELALSGTNMELFIEKRIKADIKVEGQIVLPGKFINDFLKKLTTETIGLESFDNNTIKIQYGENSTMVHCYPITDYPALQKVDIDEYLCVKQSELSNLITSTSFATAVDDVRPILKGCLLEATQTELKMVAMDGYRIAFAKCPLEDNKLITNVVVSAKSLKEINKFLVNPTDNIKLYIGNGYLRIETNNYTIMTQLLNGDFMKYDTLLDKPRDTVATISKKELKLSIERAALLTRIGENSLVRFDVQPQVLSITSRSSIGNITENINIETTGEGLAIAFNARFLLESLNALKDDFVNMSFNDSKSPITITPTNNNDKQAIIHLVLPVRLTN